MPRQVRKPCSGWGRLASTASASLAVAGPAWAAQEMMRDGVQRGVAAVGLGHVGGVGGIAGLEAAHMRGDPVVAEEDLHRGRGQADVDDLAHQAVRDRVEVAVGPDLDVVVDVGLGPPPGGELVAAWPAEAAGRDGRARSNRLRRDPASFLNGRLFTQPTSSAMAMLASARLVKWWSRSRAITQRSATSTATSTLALSRGL